MYLLVPHFLGSSFDQRLGLLRVFRRDCATHFSRVSGAPNRVGQLSWGPREEGRQPAIQLPIELTYVGLRRTKSATASGVDAHRPAAFRRYRYRATECCRGGRIDRTLSVREVRMRLSIGRAVLGAVLLFHESPENRLGAAAWRRRAGIRRDRRQAGSRRRRETQMPALRSPSRPENCCFVPRCTHSKRSRTAE
jgi:hypothetical protein